MQQNINSSPPPSLASVRAAKEAAVSDAIGILVECLKFHSTPSELRGAGVLVMKRLRSLEAKERELVERSPAHTTEQYRMAIELGESLGWDSDSMMQLFEMARAFGVRLLTREVKEKAF